MLIASLLSDMNTAVPAPIRLQRAVQTIAAEFDCDAVVLLQATAQGLIIQASVGLVPDAGGRCFAAAEHPRLARILQTRETVHFAPDTDLPDPYDGLLSAMTSAQLEVHDCLGMSLYVDGQLWGALTLDAASSGHFSQQQVAQLGALALALQAMLRVNQLETDYQHLRTTQPHGSPLKRQAHHLIGSADCFRQVLADAALVAASDLSVLIQGETGTGKELLAEYIHQHSKRKEHDMVYINCAALPDTLAESELFGHIKGAFSGAYKNRAGRFEQADQSTLFLDEVGELSLAVQAKLLRVLQSGDIQRLGSDQSHKVNVRIVAATNRDLAALVKSRQFRADLYHRLSVFPIRLPSLRERDNDILELSGYFLEQNRARLGFRGLRLSQSAQARLLAYQWPGNIRELEHVISRACIQLMQIPDRGQRIATLEEQHFSELPVADQDVPSLEVARTQALQHTNRPRKLKAQIALTQRQAIEHALHHHQGVWADAARSLGVDPSNLHKLARKVGLKS